MPSYEVAQFQLTDDAIAKFRRWVKKPRDCVINALELINIINDQYADIMRIMVGDTGLSIEQIEQIFSLVEPNVHWRFFRFTKLESLSNFTIQELKIGHAILCGFEGHVFLIAKAQNGDVIYVDPQVNEICNLANSSCIQYIANKNVYFILQASLKN